MAAASVCGLRPPIGFRSGKAISVKRLSTGPLRARVGVKTMAKVYEVTLITPTGNKVIKVDEKSYILDVADDEGIEMPYSCKAGACSSCAGKMVAGTVDQSGQSFLTEEQLEAGFVLTCVASPTSDCTIITEEEGNLF